MTFKFKVGTTVTWVRRRYGLTTGRVAGSDTKKNGNWVSVNMAPKGQNANLTKVHEKRLAKV